MIIDSHHHLWKYNASDFSWMDDSMTILKDDYFPEDLRKNLAEAGVSSTIVVQALHKTEETLWLLKLAEQYDFIKGVVGWVDLCQDITKSETEAILNHPWLVGIRHVLQDEPDDDYMLRKEFINGIGLLKKYNLCYDILIFPRHLSRAIKLVGMFPEQKFVLDHLAKPFIKDGIIEPWREQIFSIAKNTNLYCKISGMVTEANWNNWKYEDFLPYLETVTEAFGTERLMVGSDWPVCKLAAEYDQVMNIVKQYFSTFSTEEKNRIFYGNCEEFYGLKAYR